MFISNSSRPSDLYHAHNTNYIQRAERERERERDGMCGCVREMERDWDMVHKKERDREFMCVRERYIYMKVVQDLRFFFF